MKKQPTMRVLIADDHFVTREGVRTILEKQPDIEVAAEASDWSGAVEKILLHKPDVAVLDLRMPGMEPEIAILTIRKHMPTLGIIILSSFYGEEEVHRVIRAGANGYVLKETGGTELLDCVRAVREGRNWLDPTVAASLAARLRAPGLTQRETQVLELVAAGKSNKEIGVQLGVTEGTVKIHVNHLLAKLGVDGRVPATIRALQRGIVRLPKVS
jgi:two-component system NarL family response regulator